MIEAKARAVCGGAKSQAHSDLGSARGAACGACSVLGSFNKSSKGQRYFCNLKIINLRSLLINDHLAYCDYLHQS